MQFRDDKPINAQIADLIIEKLLLNGYREQKRISSVRDLAVELGVSPNTVNIAYAYLQEQGLIYMKRGMGYFIADGAVKRARDLKCQELFCGKLRDIYQQMKLLQLSFADLQRELEKIAAEEAAQEGVL